MYTKTIWKDQNVEHPRTYEMTENGNGTITLLDAFGEVTELGTPVNAANLNHIENGIKDNETEIIALKNQKANTALDNLTPEGENRLHALKSYEDAGEALTDTEGFTDVYKYSHTTFDTNKYLKTGTPVISENGIASGFNTTTGITLNMYFNPQGTWTIKGSFTTPETTPSGPQSIISTNNTVSNRIAINSSMKLALYLSYDNANYFVNSAGNTTLELNTKYYYDLSFDGTKYVLKVSTDGINWTVDHEVAQSNSIYTTSTSRLTIGTVGGQYELYTGSIDLKDITVIMGGVEVFNGNKQGLDVIKPFNYKTGTRLYAYVYDTHKIYSDSDTTPTVLYNADGSFYTGADWTVSEGVIYYDSNAATYTVGQNIGLTLDNATCDAGATITEDGVITALKVPEQRVISPTLDFDSTKPFKIYAKVTAGTGKIYFSSATNGTTTSAAFNIGMQSGTLHPQMQVTTNDSGSSWNINVQTYRELEEGKDYYLLFEWTGTTYNLFASEDSINWVLECTSTNSNPPKPWNTINFGRWDVYGGVSGDAIDLNGTRLYVQDNLIYQSCLIIPYTESITGAKIAQSKYLPRVADMYAQFGTAPYYTLDTVNGTFTLPMGELYGMLNKKANLDLNNTDPGLEFRTKSIGWGLPDLTRGVSKTDEFTADADGWVEVYGDVDGGEVSVTVNGTGVWHIGSSGATLPSVGSGGLFPVAKGDTVKLNLSAQNVITYTATFYPMKGEN